MVIDSINKYFTVKKNNDINYIMATIYYSIDDKKYYCLIQSTTKILPFFGDIYNNFKVYYREWQELFICKRRTEKTTKKIYNYIDTELSYIVKEYAKKYKLHLI